MEPGKSKNDQLDIEALTGLVERGAKSLTLIHSDGHAYVMRIRRIPATTIDLLSEGVVRLPLSNKKKGTNEETN